MDKSLKKLSRVELLEILVGLSEDYENVCAENARLKRMLANKRMSRTAKVGSIAQEALQANRYFESVQRSADEYLREIQRLRDELASRARSAGPRSGQEAQAQAQAIIRDAQAQAQRIIAQAQAQAHSMGAPRPPMGGAEPSMLQGQGRSLDMPSRRFQGRGRKDR